MIIYICLLFSACDFQLYKNKIFHSKILFFCYHLIYYLIIYTIRPAAVLAQMLSKGGVLRKNDQVLIIFFIGSIPLVQPQEERKIELEHNSAF